MRFFGGCLGLAALAVLVGGAAPLAPAAPGHLIRIVAAPKTATQTGLRGAQGPGPVRVQPSLALRAGPLPIASVAPVDAGECREACARPYYFCLARENDGGCPQDWSHCLTACDEPPPAP